MRLSQAGNLRTGWKMTQLEMFPAKKLYSCHSQITPNRLTKLSPEGDIVTNPVVQDGYKTPHPMLRTGEDNECDRTPNYVRIESRWMNVRCGYLHKATDRNCEECDCLPLPIANKRV